MSDEPSIYVIFWIMLFLKMLMLVFPKVINNGFNVCLLFFC